MTNSKIRTLRWIAPVAMAGVLGFAACGGNDATEDARTESGVVSQGSDTHLFNKAEELARQESAYAAASSAVSQGSKPHLFNKAEELARQESAYAAASSAVSRGSDTHLFNKAEELARRESAYAAASADVSRGSDTHLYNQAEENAKSAGSSDDNMPNPVEAGNKAAEAYSSDEFVPGSGHMPVR